MGGEVDLFRQGIDKELQGIILDPVSWQRRQSMSKKKRGNPKSYSESKIKVGISLTPTTAERLKEIADGVGISRSELVERIGRGDFDLLRQAAQVTINSTDAPPKIESSENGARVMTAPAQEQRMVPVEEGASQR